MQRNNATATSLFAHLKKREARDPHVDEDEKQSSSARKDPSGKHGSNGAGAGKTAQAKTVPPGQKSIMAFFAKPKRDRDDAERNEIDVGECSTVLSEKRRRVQQDVEKEPDDLPSSFSQWERTWDAATSGLEWNKEHSGDAEAKGDSSACQQPPAQSKRVQSRNADVPERKSLLLHLDEEGDDEGQGTSSAKEEVEFPKSIVQGTANIKVKLHRDPHTSQTKLLGAFSAPTRPASVAASKERKPAEVAMREGKEREKAHDPQPPHEDARRGVEGALPADYRDAWDDKHVRLPCSPRNVSVASSARRWDTVRQALWPPSKLESFGALRRAILTYMSGASAARQGDSRKWPFQNLRLVLEEDLDRTERRTFFWSTLPHMVRLALALPSVCPEPVPLLRAGAARTVELSALQCASLLANAFFCTFPAAAAREQRGKFPYVNFSNLFEAEDAAEQGPKRREKREKLRCLLHYFDRTALRLDAAPEADDAAASPGAARYGSKLAARRVSFSRRVLSENLRWERSGARFGAAGLALHHGGTIEDADRSGRAWQADFANCVIGGGVLGKGAVQEEIRFLLSPELIVSRLLCEQLGPREGVVVAGSERFCNYAGYASTFRFAGDHVDAAEVDARGRLRTVVTAMDAIFFYRREYLDQFRREALQRELNKALVAFCEADDARLMREEEEEEEEREGRDGERAAAGERGESVATVATGSVGAGRAGPVATGNWGCGVFGGDPFLKGVIQIMAAAEAAESQRRRGAGRGLEYFTFGDEKLSRALVEVHGALVRSRCSVGELFEALLDFVPLPDSKPPAGAGQALRSFLLRRLHRGGAAASGGAGDDGDEDARERTP